MTGAGFESRYAAGVKMREGVASRGTQVASRIRKGKGTAFSPPREPPEGNAAPPMPCSSPATTAWDLGTER